LAGIAAAAAARARSVVLVMALLTAVLFVPASRGGFDVDLTHPRPAASAASAVQDAIAARFGVHAQARAVLVQAPTLEEALQGSEAVAARLEAYRTEGLLQSAHGITVLLPSERTQRERLAAFNRLPREQVVEDLRAALNRHGFVVDGFAAFI